MIIIVIFIRNDNIFIYIVIDFLDLSWFYSKVCCFVGLVNFFCYWLLLDFLFFFCVVVLVVFVFML